MKKTSSDVWQFFDRLEEDKRCVAVACKLCGTESKYFGNTTNLRVHLTKKHPIQWELRDMGWEKVKTQAGSQSLTEVSLPTHTHQDNENEQDSEATGNVDMSEEEWLEEEYSPIAHVYEPKSKKRRTKLTPKIIKRELRSPPPVDEPNQSSTSDAMPLKSGHYIIDDAHKDEHAVFGEYIARKLRKLKNPRTQGNVQQLISTILWQAEFGMFDDVDSVRRIMMNADVLCQTNSNPLLVNTSNQAAPKITIELLKSNADIDANDNQSV